MSLHQLFRPDKMLGHQSVAGVMLFMKRQGRDGHKAAEMNRGRLPKSHGVKPLVTLTPAIYLIAMVFYVFLKGYIH